MSFGRLCDMARAADAIGAGTAQKYGESLWLRVLAAGNPHSGGPKPPLWVGDFPYSPRIHRT